MGNKVLIIAGMHRSGTSLITQWVNKCGLSVGDELMGEGVGNQEGHFEDMDFVRLHENLLQQNGQEPSGLLVERMPAISGEQRQQVAAMVAGKNEDGHTWGWKDPRTCLFLPAYREVLPQAYSLVIIRDYKAVVSSLLTRMHKETALSYAGRGWWPRLLWKLGENKSRRKLICRKYATVFLKACTVYNEALLQHIDHLPPSRYLVVDYALLGKNDNVVFTHLQNEWQFPLHYRPFSDVFKDNLMTKQIDFATYIKDKTLLVRAEEAERKLRAAIR